MLPSNSTLSASYDDPNEWQIIPGLNESDVDFLPFSTGTPAGGTSTQIFPRIGEIPSITSGGTPRRSRSSPAHHSRHPRSRSSPAPRLVLSRSSFFAATSMTTAEQLFSISRTVSALPISIPISRNSLTETRRPSFNADAQIYAPTIVHARDLEVDIVSHEEDAAAWALLDPITPDRSDRFSVRIATLAVRFSGFYSDSPFDFEPSVLIKQTSAICTLVTGPRPPLCSTALSRRAPSRSYSVTFDGGLAETRREIDPGSICMGPDWVGPTLVADRLATPTSSSRTVYTNNIYVPIPVWMFAKTDTRLFDFKVKVWVSIANNAPVEVEVSKRLRFGHFVRIQEADHSACSLTD
ncbi:hypothetical protein FIBSPDRAFT_851646 [Athelia psychrophila]|uniref:Uncharacterized protein n=1 Tax=Athelia psychrophila TaxID=1759441 RepID=A0A166SC25_9AGAM|nr:hypothetical protein FIBSPDRAFT_851646 [Fibularhizoctonia sp. CBS 109695]